MEFDSVILPYINGSVLSLSILAIVFVVKGALVKLLYCLLAVL